MRSAARIGVIGGLAVSQVFTLDPTPGSGDARLGGHASALHAREG